MTQLMPVFNVIFLILSHILTKILNSYNAQLTLFHYLKFYIIYIENVQELVVNLYVKCVTYLYILNQLRKGKIYFPYSFLTKHNISLLVAV